MKKVRKYLPITVIALAIAYFINRSVDIFIKTPGNLYQDKLPNFRSTLIPTLKANPYVISFDSAPLIATAIFFGFILLIITSRDYRKYRRGEEFGSSREGTLVDIKPFSDKNFSNNIILGEDAFLSIYNTYKNAALQRNKNVFVAGGPGSWKSSTYNIPNISQMNASFLITDPKGELRNATAKMLEDNGYDVKVLDLKTLTNTDQFNPFAYIHTEEMLEDVIEVIINASNGELEKQGEPFWDNSEKLLLSALFSYLYYSYKGYKGIPGSGEMPCLADIAELVRYLDSPEEDVKSPVEIMFDDFEEYFGSDNPAVLTFKSFKNYKGDTRASVISMPSARFRMFNLESVKSITSRDTMELDKVGEKKTAIFIVLSDLNGTYNFLASLFFMLSFQLLEDVADYKHGGKLPIPVRMIFEEFPSIGKIPNILKAIAIFRGRQVGFEFTAQNFDQLKRIYKDTWEEIIGACDSLVYLSGSTTELTVKTFSKRSGDQTIGKKSDGRSFGGSQGGSQNTDSTGRKVFMEDEVERLDRLHALVKISNQPVVKVKKYNARKHPRAKQWDDKPGSKNWYEYQRYSTELEEIEASVAQNPENEMLVVTELSA